MFFLVGVVGDFFVVFCRCTWLWVVLGLGFTWIVRRWLRGLLGRLVVFSLSVLLCWGGWLRFGVFGVVLLR